jgi:hypothetical protein
MKSITTLFTISVAAIGWAAPVALGAYLDVGAEGNVATAYVSYDLNGDSALNNTAVNGIKDKLNVSVGLAKISGIEKQWSATKHQYVVVPGGINVRTVCMDVGNTLHDGNYVIGSPEGLLGFKPSWGNGVSPENADLASKAAAYLVYKSGVNEASAPERFQALQLAVWEALYDTPSTLSFATGRFKVNGVASTIREEAQVYLDNLILARKSGAVPEMQFQILVGDATNQELFFEIGTINPVPEPATIFAGALLLLPLGVSTYRILRKQA